MASPKEKLTNIFRVHDPSGTGVLPRDAARRALDSFLDSGLQQFATADGSAVNYGGFLEWLCGDAASLPSLESSSQEKMDVDLFDRDSLVRWLKWADVALIDTKWLEMAPLKDIEQRRQDLPAEAFVPHSELDSKPVVSFTYGWNHPAHPDPAGKYASALQKYFGMSGTEYGTTKYPNGAALFWDHKSLHQHKIGMNWDGSRETRDAHMLVWRTGEEERSFKRALSGMQALYFHSEADAIVMTQVPPAGKSPTPYEKRGWTAMECAGAGLSGKILPLTLDGYLDPIFSAATPMTPQDFNVELDKRKFTDSGDIELVRGMYRDGFEACTNQARELHANVGYANRGQCELPARSLLMFRQLAKLRLKGYPNSDEPRLPNVDRALDTLAAKGCQVFADWGFPERHPWPRATSGAPGERERSRRKGVRCALAGEGMLEDGRHGAD